MNHLNEGGAGGLFDESSPPPKEEDIFSITQLNRKARSLLEGALSSIWVEGEISNLSRSSSNHLYLTLKDSNSEIDAVMFAGDNRFLQFEPEDGMAVLVKGTLTIYEKRGRYQLKISEMKEAGLGELQLKFERLKKKLQKEGLFDSEHKKPLPRFPTSIGIVTSAGGAAVRDIVRTIEDRFPGVRLFLFPVKVQGEGASEEIASAIASANRFSSDHTALGLLIVGRGGGSLEDLWPFNEEVVARAIFNSALPVVSAVGHEVDFSISDFVADLRVATPTAAGKESVPEAEHLMSQIVDLKQRMIRIINRKRSTLEERLNRLKKSYAFKLPFRTLEDHSQQLDDYVTGLVKSVTRIVDQNERRLSELAGRLSVANPANLLRRGYSVTMDKNGEVVTDASNVEEGEIIRTRLDKGGLSSEIREVREND